MIQSPPDFPTASVLVGMIITFSIFFIMKKRKRRRDLNDYITKIALEIKEENEASIKWFCKKFEEIDFPIEFEHRVDLQMYLYNNHMRKLQTEYVQETNNSIDYLDRVEICDEGVKHLISIGKIQFTQ